jgi:hypothetical protein
LWLVLLIVVVAPAQAMAQNSALLRSLVIPGTGQAHKGHYKKAALFAGAAVLSGVGLVITQVHYNQAVTKFRNERRTYLYYPEQYNNGQIVSVDDINATYREMENAWNDAESRLKWRNTFLVGLLATYALNIVDVLITEPSSVDDTAQRYSVEVDRERVLVTRSIRF